MNTNNAIRKREIEIIDILFGGKADFFNVRFEDGSEWKRCIYPRFTLILNDPSVLAEILLSRNDYVAGRAFIERRWDVEGDILDFFGLAAVIDGVKLTRAEKTRIASLVVAIGFYAGLDRARALLPSSGRFSHDLLSHQRGGQ